MIKRIIFSRFSRCDSKPGDYGGIAYSLDSTKKKYLFRIEAQPRDTDNLERCVDSVNKMIDYCNGGNQ